jgi:hypothetical protein
MRHAKLVCEDRASFCRTQNRSVYRTPQSSIRAHLSLDQRLQRRRPVALPQQVGGRQLQLSPRGRQLAGQLLDLQLQASLAGLLQTGVVLRVSGQATRSRPIIPSQSHTKSAHLCRIQPVERVPPLPPQPLRVRLDRPRLQPALAQQAVSLGRGGAHLAASVGVGWIRLLVRELVGGISLHIASEMN